MIASDKNYWNNCAFSQVRLKLHKQTGRFAILCINVTQLLKHFRNVISRYSVLVCYCLSSFYAFCHSTEEST